MTNDDKPTRGGYRVSSRLLAQKGGAEPLSSTGVPLVLAGDKGRTPTDEEHLTGAVVDATLGLLVERPRGRAPQGPAPLTDLFDPTLIDAARRKTTSF